mmetsp:Transcript_23665/g.37610  ORF Transcript_23665/g.37610 Transcript_23665/m.37610 type:complete len:84 (+) Transcript_23665:755-1006(+)
MMYRKTLCIWLETMCHCTNKTKSFQSEKRDDCIEDILLFDHGHSRIVVLGLHIHWVSVFALFLHPASRWVCALYSDINRCLLK